MRLLVLLLLSITNGLTFTQGYPTKPVRIIEPFGVGGGPDLVARAISPKLSDLWGQPVTVENHPGKGSTQAPALVAKSPPDGYTLLVNTSAQAYSAALVKTLPYDPLKDFIPVAPLTSQPYVLVAGKSSGITSVGELIAAAKAKPGELKFGSVSARAGTRVATSDCNRGAETQGRANRRCTSAKRVIPICGRCWCRERTTYSARLELIAICEDGV